MAEIRVQATRVDHWRGPKTEWRSYRTMGDRLGNTVHMRLNLEGPNPHITAWRENRQGVRFGDSLRVDWQGNSGERQNRPDDATMWGAGRSAFFKLSTHANEGGAPVERDCDEWRYEWQNVRDPWPGEEAGAAIDELEGAAHDMAPEVGGGGGGEVDYERIIERTSDKVIEKLMRDNGVVELLVGNMAAKSNAAIVDKGVLVRSDLDGEGAFYRSNGLWARLNETVGEQIGKIVRGVDPYTIAIRVAFKDMIREVIQEESTKPKGGAKP